MTRSIRKTTAKTSRLRRSLALILPLTLMTVLASPASTQVVEPSHEPSQEQVQEQDQKQVPTSTTAVQLLDLLQPRHDMMLVFHNLLPNPAARNLADRLVSEYPEVWSDFDADYAALLSETFTEKQLQEILAFMSSETGQLWRQSAAGLTEHLQAGSNDPKSLTFRMAAIGCAIGVLAPGDTEVTDATYEATRSRREAAIETCDCLLAKAVEKWPSVPIAQQLLKPESQSYFGELLEGGVCPMPQ
jgi:hypothetical protein